MICSSHVHTCSVCRDVSTHMHANFRYFSVFPAPSGATRQYPLPTAPLVRSTPLITCSNAWQCALCASCATAQMLAPPRVPLHARITVQTAVV